MKAQMQPLGLAFDWSREIATCDPSYYKWNQWFFLKMLDKGIAYKKTQVVNWDPVDQTVLANEQVIDGRGWRSDAIVERREIPGYYFAITKYAEELLANVADPDNPDYLHGWPERVRLMQEQWIGKSEGVRFAFPHEIAAATAQLDPGRPHVGLHRPAPTRIMGVTFCAVAPEHPAATTPPPHQPKLSAFIEQCKKGGTTEAELALKDKEGMPDGLIVHAPARPASRRRVGGQLRADGLRRRRGDGRARRTTSATSRSPKKYGIDILQVITVDDEISPTTTGRTGTPTRPTAVTGQLRLLQRPGLPAAGRRGGQGARAQGASAARRRPGACATGASAASATGARRSRSSIAPSCGDVPVPESDLPVLLPEDLIPDGSGNPLNKSHAFLDVACPSCGKPARRETDTMDTFVDSAWYYMRYCCPDNMRAMVDERNDYWMPMDQYIGGIEHAVLHLLYARFWTKQCATSASSTSASRSPSCSRRACCSTSRSTAMTRAARSAGSIPARSTSGTTTRATRSARRRARTGSR
jgi:leucyl-tRNA synthetase